jgi:hypothetical protein
MINLKALIQGRNEKRVGKGRRTFAELFAYFRKILKL